MVRYDYTLLDMTSNLSYVQTLIFIYIIIQWLELSGRTFLSFLYWKLVNVHFAERYRHGRDTT